VLQRECDVRCDEERKRQDVRRAAAKAIGEAADKGRGDALEDLDWLGSGLLGLGVMLGAGPCRLLS
jgi:hypothetical protein